MSEDKPSLHVDLDWKKQAQEEKKRLEEAEQKRKAEEAARQAAPAPAIGTVAAPAPGMPGMGGMEDDLAAAAAAAAPAGRAPARARGGRETPQASIQTLVQSLLTQAMYYLSDQRGDEVASMDMARHMLDTLAVVEDKTRGNLTEDEQKYLDIALYEGRRRFISTAAEIVAGA